MSDEVPEPKRIEPGKDPIDPTQDYTWEEVEAWMQRREGLQATALIWSPEHGHGIAICIGENLAEGWQSGDVIIFWPNGDHTTMLPEAIVRVICTNCYVPPLDW